MRVKERKHQFIYNLVYLHNLVYKNKSVFRITVRNFYCPWATPLLPELTLDLGSLGLLLLTKPACIRCSVNWPFMLCSIWMINGEITSNLQMWSIVYENDSMWSQEKHFQSARLTWSVLADRKLSQQYSLSYLAPRCLASSQPWTINGQ